MAASLHNGVEVFARIDDLSGEHLTCADLEGIGADVSSASLTVREAYADLLSLPLPKTKAEYRRAIMMGVLIGRETERLMALDCNREAVAEREPDDA